MECKAGDHGGQRQYEACIEIKIKISLKKLIPAARERLSKTHKKAFSATGDEGTCRDSQLGECVRRATRNCSCIWVWIRPRDPWGNSGEEYEVIAGDAVLCSKEVRSWKMEREHSHDIRQ